ncbi:MAG: MFS transporter [Chloroflexota bacterium]
MARLPAAPAQPRGAPVDRRCHPAAGRPPRGGAVTRALLRLNRRAFASLRYRNYRLFFAGQVVSVTGTWMQNVATAWLVLELTGSPVAVGVLALCQFLPFTALGLFAGVLVDRADARRLVTATQAASMVLASSLAALTLVGLVQPWQVYLVAALRGSVLVFDAPARQALTYQMVGPKELPNAVALNSSLFNGARVVGPALGGVVVAVAGPGLCFALNAVSFLAVLAGLAAMRDQDLLSLERGGEPPTLLRGTWAALGYAWRTPRVALVLGLVFVSSTFAFNFNVLLPVLAKDTLRSGAAVFGILTSCFGAGALAGALLAAVMARASVGTFLLGTGAFGLAELLLAPERSLPAAAALLFASGLSFTLWSANANATLQLEAPDALRGRIVSLYYYAFNGAQPAGGMLAGFLAATGGTALAFGVGGSVTLVACLLALARSEERPRLDLAGLLGRS